MLKIRLTKKLMTNWMRLNSLMKMIIKRKICSVNSEEISPKTDILPNFKLPFPYFISFYTCYIIIQLL